MELTSRNVALLLLKAGDTGITTTGIGLELDRAHRTWIQQSNRVNQYLRRLAGRGTAYRGNTERSPLYYGSPVHRWFAMPGLQEYVDSWMTPEQRAAAKARASEKREQVRARREAYRKILLDAAQNTPNLACRKVRAEVIRELRATRIITLDEAGAVFGITRERARQIQAGMDDDAICNCRICVANRKRAAEKVQ